MDHLPHSVVSSLILFSRWFDTFIYYGMNRIAFVTTNFTLVILLHIIDFGFNIIGPYGVFFFRAAIKRDSFSLLRFPIRSNIQVFSYDISPLCPLKCPMVLSMLQRGLLRCLSLWWDICRRVSFREVFSFVLGILFSFSSFFSACLMVFASNIPK